MQMSPISATHLVIVIKESKRVDELCRHSTIKIVRRTSKILGCYSKTRRTFAKLGWMIQKLNNRLIRLIFFLLRHIRHGSASAETRQAKCFKDAKARAAEVAGGKRHRMSNLYITLEIDGTKSLSMYAYMRGCQ